MTRLKAIAYLLMFLTFYTAVSTIDYYSAPTLLSNTRD